MFRFIQASRLTKRSWRAASTPKVELLSIMLMVSLGAFAMASSPVGAAGLQRSLAGVDPVLTVGSADVLVGDTFSIPITLSEAPNGIGGFAIDITLDTPAIAGMTEADFPNFGLTDVTRISSSHLILHAADVSELIGPGDTEIKLADVTIVATGVGSRVLTASVVRLDDDDGLPMTPTIHHGVIEVRNIAPSVHAGPDVFVQKGRELVIAGSFDDSTGSEWTSTIGFGDVDSARPLMLNENQFEASHVYAHAGVYVVTVTVTDNFGASGLDSLQVTVVDPTLTVGSADVLVGNTVSIPITLSEAHNGIGGFAIEMALEAPSAAVIKDIIFPSFGLTDIVWISGTHVVLHAADVSELVGPGDTDIKLAEVVLYGTDVGSSSVNASVLTLDDDDGLPLTLTIRSGTIDVRNDSPVVHVGPGSEILEGQTFAGVGSFEDAGGETWTATVDYGDGSGVQTLAIHVTEFELGHTYGDDGLYRVTVTVEDSFGASGSDSALVTVTNVSPEVRVGGGVIISDGDTYSSAGRFEDPGRDTWTATVDYGEGAGPHALTLDGKTFSLSHRYAEHGLYEVSVTVTDDEGASGTSYFSVQVERVCPVLAGTSRPSADLDGDLKCEDLNGNGRLDFADIVYLFRNLSSPDIEGNVDFFDFNGNSRMDMDDVVTLFLTVVALSQEAD